MINEIHSLWTLTNFKTELASILSIHVDWITNLSLGLGFAIKETLSGIIVQSIAKGGTADRDGQLNKGDYIIAVNEHTLKDVSYEMVGYIFFK